MKSFRLLNPRKGTETPSSSWESSVKAFRLLNPRKGTETCGCGGSNGAFVILSAYLIPARGLKQLY